METPMSIFDLSGRVAVITGGNGGIGLGIAQALPILRSASPEDADQRTTDAARRRLGVIRDVLHELTTPRFG